MCDREERDECTVNGGEIEREREMFVEWGEGLLGTIYMLPISIGNLSGTHKGRMEAINFFPPKYYNMYTHPCVYAPYY